MTRNLSIRKSSGCTYLDCPHCFFISYVGYDVQKNGLRRQPEHSEYWTKSSNDDFETMMVMYESGRYNWALFIGHLMIEKLLKAYYIKNRNDYPPFIHNLLRLAEISGIKLTEDQKLFFATVTAFNINSRYNDYKMSFKKKCTFNFTTNWIDQLKNQRTWIKELLNQ